MRSSFEFFFFSFLHKYLSRYSCYHAWGLPIFGFSRFLDFLKNIFGKMQSRADGGGKYPNEEEYVCLVLLLGRVCLLGFFWI